MNIPERRSWLGRLLCRHERVGLARWHAACVTSSMRGKELFVDVFEVHNFIRCQECGKFLTVVRGEKIYAPKADE
jgi:hypothetical protein